MAGGLHLGAMLLSVSICWAHAVTYEWRTGEWSLCRHTECGAGGTQTRHVWCIRTSHDETKPREKIVEDDKCKLHIRPERSQQCFHVCDFHRYQYQWHVPSWSPCKPRQGQSHCEELEGIQTRNVTCVAKCGGSAPSDDICASFTPKPATEQICEQMCPRNCIVTDYGHWTNCDMCWVQNATRYRSVVSAPTFGGRECANMTQTRPCPWRRECEENRYTNFQYKLGNWTECMSYHASEQRSSRGFSSVLGHRRRTVDCVNVKGMLVDKKYCSHLNHPPSVQLCELPRDCLVSHWTTWSNWTAISQSVPTPSSPPTLTRQRSIIHEPRGLGKICPELTQSREVKVKLEVDCKAYQWVRGNWGDCRLTVDGHTCGVGVQTRPVLCLRHADTVPVPDHHCAYEAPIHTRSCSVPCPQDCLMGPWSEWGECLKKKCTASRRSRKDKGYRTRSRLVLRELAHGGSLCQHDKDIQECSYPSCYSWRVRTRGRCQLKYPDMQCGEGKQDRDVDCVNNNGDVVSSINCYETKPSLEEPCYIPCSSDCVTSDWGAWSPCSKTCGLGGGAGYRTRRREILASPSSDGRSCPVSRFLTEQDRCNEYPCTTYHWLAQSWGDCHLTAAGQRCGVGRQDRSVVCHSSDGEEVTNKNSKCHPEETPSTYRNCTVTCPRNCVFSDFTDWSPCPVTCLKDDARTLPEQYRYRFVLETPSPDGVPCPELKEARPCMNLPRCATYRWRESDWSQCMYATHYDHCGHGYRAREVRCLNDKDVVLDEEICTDQLGLMPIKTESCHVPSCNDESCKFSDWSEWTGCTKRCGGTRTRQRHMEGLTSRMMYCYDRTNYPLEETESCDCPLFMPKQVGNWSSCLLDGEIIDSRHKRPDPDGYYVNTKSIKDNIGQLKPNFRHCGVGKRTQSIICESHSLNVSANVCHESAFAEEMCFIPWPRDCVMSEWMSWGECITPLRCGNGVRKRSRYQEETSLDGGRGCPDLQEGEETQTESCSVSCEQFNWVRESWRECSALASLATGYNCGPGIQTRIVRCMKTYDSGDSVEVREAFCDPRSKPLETEQCEVPCPGHCVTSPWSQWSTCAQGCISNSTRIRTRSIERQPSTRSRTYCPPLQEVEYCQLGATCFRYSWKVTSWSVCLADQGVSCGRGRRHRHKECQRSDGQPMQNRYCDNLPVSPADLVTEEDCDVPCPIDCVVSEWTEWDSCSKSCDLGYQTRSRKVLIHQAHKGRDCPDPLKQLRPCPFTECFHWSVTDWSQCNIETGSCGYGTQTRNLSCVRHDGVQADISLCPVVARAHVELRQTCILPCPGDCVLTQWSSWGPCHRPCEAPPDTVGLQSRSRVVRAYPTRSGEPCPERLYETRQCHGGSCPQYHWYQSEWYGNRRSVWCQRSDGMRVYQGGCKSSVQPPTIKACSPDCTVPHTYCRDVDTCACVQGYQAVYQGSNIVWCEKMKSYNASGEKGEEVENQALSRPGDGPSNFWVYAVIAAGSAFVIFVAAALYTIFRYSRRDQTSRQTTCEASPSNTMMKKAYPPVPINGTPLVQRPPPMTTLDSTYYELADDKT